MENIIKKQIIFVMNTTRGYGSMTVGFFYDESGNPDYMELFSNFGECQRNCRAFNDPKFILGKKINLLMEEDYFHGTGKFHGPGIQNSRINESLKIMSDFKSGIFPDFQIFDTDEKQRLGTALMGNLVAIAIKSQGGRYPIYFGYLKSDFQWNGIF